MKPPAPVTSVRGLFVLTGFPLGSGRWPDRVVPNQKTPAMSTDR
jgi:hypothetical protein